MIPAKPDADARAHYVANIVETWEAASVAQRERGKAWYRTANQLAGMIAGCPRKGAGVIAALSANKGWEPNKELATRACVNGKASGHLGDAVSKADRILDGESPLDVLPMGIKTGHFFRCIADPTDAEAVCIDRHAHDVAVGERYGNANRGLGAKGRYEALADCYREAARQLGELPQVVQAVTWTVQIEKG